jgi:NAD(P)-dependent dehydrogenase (short-subunit alcohol dehydrogenase family)
MFSAASLSLPLTASRYRRHGKLEAMLAAEPGHSLVNTSAAENRFAQPVANAIMTAMSRSVPIPVTTRHALVTGGGGGLGRAFCLQLAHEGWYVGVTDIDLAAAVKTLALLTAAGGDGQADRLDVTDAAAWQELVARLRSEWPQLDLLVNNAGVCAAGEIGDAPLGTFRNVVDVNFYGVLNGCQAMVPWLKETAPGGQVVNIASIFGLVAPPAMGAYNASKAAVVALSETLYGELSPHGIGVTVVAPGFFASHLLGQGSFATQQQRQIAEQTMERARLTAEDVVGRTLTAIQAGSLYVVLGRKARWIWRLKRWLPSRFAQLIVWSYRRKLRHVAGRD